MAISPSLLPLSLFLLILCHGSMGQLGSGEGQESQRRFDEQSECRLDRLSPLEPTRRVESEAGVTEYFDENDQQFRCAGVTALRRTIQPRGLSLPSYFNAPILIYILQGEGFSGTVIPGCPETFQSFLQRDPRTEKGEQGQTPRDQHQRIQRFRQGDIIASPAGVANWWYNDGDTPVIAVAVIDTSNNANQLDRRPRQFLLAGSQQQSGEHQSHGQEQSSKDHILSGFDLELLAEGLGVSQEVARKIQSRERRQGDIVRVEKGLQLVRPPRREEERASEEEEEREGKRMTNGVEQAFCNQRLRENIDDPARADVYSPQGGRITNLNSQKLPILRSIQLSAERGVLNKGAILTPHWNINAHSVVYATRGRARVQIVGDGGRRVFDGELRQGQLVIVPQNFAVIKQAREEVFEWVSFKTNGNAITSQIAGRDSVLGGIPVDVIANSYPGLSREEARMVKSNRREQVAIFPSRPQQGRHGDA